MANQSSTVADVALRHLATDPFRNTTLDFLSGSGGGSNRTTSDPEPWVIYPEDIVITAISCLAFILNILTLVAMRLGIRTVNNSHVLVANQCIVNSVFALSNIAFFIVHVTTYRTGVVCLDILPFTIINLSSVLVGVNLIAISIDRFLAVVKPLRYAMITSRRQAYAGVGSVHVVFLLSTIALVAFAFSHAGSSNGSGDYSDSGTPDTSSPCMKSNDVVHHSLITILILDTLTLVTVYSYIFRRSRQLLRDQPGSGTQQNVMASLLIVLSFIVLNGLESVFFALRLFANNSAIQLIGRFTVTFPSVNCVCDPFIYAVRLNDVKRGYRTMIAAFRSSTSGRVGHRGRRTMDSADAPLSRSNVTATGNTTLDDYCHDFNNVSVHTSKSIL